MAQVTDYTVSNQTFPNTRADINNIFEAIGTNNSGTSAPTNQLAGQFWIDTTSTTWTLYIHDGTDDIQFATIDTSANTVNFVDSALDVVTDTTPQLGGNLDLNSNDITGTGNINITGNITASGNLAGTLTTASQTNITSVGTLTGLTVNGNLSVDGGTIKLDGNYPVATGNVALGNQALDNGSLTGNYNTALGNLALTDNSSGGNNVAVGYGALQDNTTAQENVAIGYVSMYYNQTGQYNVAVGKGSLVNNISGSYNVAIGNDALELNTASHNTAVGFEALTANTSGGANVGVGRSALQGNQTGTSNIAIGYQAMLTNSSGINNVAVGRQALYYTTASNNTAVGYLTGEDISTGDNNAIFGAEAGKNITTGTDNTAIGSTALQSCTTSSDNTCIGHQSGNGTTGTGNTFLGRDSGFYVTSGSKNTIIGQFNGNENGLDISTSSNNIVLSDGDGNPRQWIDSAGRARIGSTLTNNHRLIVEHSEADYVSRFVNNLSSTPYGIRVAYQNASPDNNDNQFLACTDTTTARLMIWSDGDVDNHDNSYSGFSDIKLKEQIVDASNQWEDIKAIRIRKFKFKSDVADKGDSDAHWRLGVIAQEIETVSPSLVSEKTDRDDQNNDLGTTTKSVKYSVLYMKAVKALQEAMQKIEDLEARVNTLEGN